MTCSNYHLYDKEIEVPNDKEIEVPNMLIIESTSTIPYLYTMKILFTFKFLDCYYQCHLNFIVIIILSLELKNSHFIFLILKFSQLTLYIKISIKNR